MGVIVGPLIREIGDKYPKKQSQNKQPLIVIFTFGLHQLYIYNL